MPPVPLFFRNRSVAYSGLNYTRLLYRVKGFEKIDSKFVLQFFHSGTFFCMPERLMYILSGFVIMETR